jgi:hypothetical protein
METAFSKRDRVGWLARSSRAQGSARVRPICSSKWRMGSSPASPESWPGDGSMTSGVPKRLRVCDQACGILLGYLPGRKNLQTQ